MCKHKKIEMVKVWAYTDYDSIWDSIVKMCTPSMRPRYIIEVTCKKCGEVLETIGEYPKERRAVERRKSRYSNISYQSLSAGNRSVDSTL